MEHRIRYSIGEIMPKEKCCQITITRRIKRCPNEKAKVLWIEIITPDIGTNGSK